MRGFLVAVLTLTLLGGSVFAQAPAVDPLGDPYLRELVRRARGSNELLATSISDALRLKLDDYASDFLVSLGKRNLSPEQLAELTRQISSERLLRVVVEPQFTPESKSQATKMLEALQALDRDAKRISSAITGLFKPSPDEQLAALRIVLAGGDQSIALLSVAAAKETDVSKRDELLRVMLRLGNGGRAAMRQLAIYGNDSIRPGALSALMRLGTDRATPVVATAVHDSKATATEKSIAEDWLVKRYQVVPSRKDAEGFLLDRLALQRESIGRIEDSQAVVTLWTIGDDLASVVFTSVVAIDAAWREVIDYARLIHRLDPLSSEAIRAGVGAELAYRYHLDPIVIGEASKEVSSIWGAESISVHSLSDMIGQSIQEGDLSVAVAALALIGDSMKGQAETLMTTHSDVLTPLVAAASHPQQRLRYHAAAAIGRLGFDQPYAGSSYVMSRWLEMVGLSREPIVLLVETRLEVEAQIERLLTSMGYRMEVVSTVEDAIKAVDRGGDIRFLISTTVLPDRSSLELLDAVRRRPLGADIPVILHGPIDRGVDAAVTDIRWPAIVTHVALPNTAAGWSLILEPVEASRLLPNLSDVERLDFRNAGADSLGMIASNRDKFGFYEFGKLAGAPLSGAGSSVDSTTVAFGQPVLAVLSVSASRDSQAALAELAMRETIPAVQRQAAAEALVQSIRGDGILLWGEDLSRIAETRQLMDNELRKSIDLVLVEIGKRTDVRDIPIGSVESK